MINEPLTKIEHCPTNGQQAIKGKHECLADALVSIIEHVFI